MSVVCVWIEAEVEVEGLRGGAQERGYGVGVGAGVYLGGSGRVWVWVSSTESTEPCLVDRCMQLPRRVYREFIGRCRVYFTPHSEP